MFKLYGGYDRNNLLNYILLIYTYNKKQGTQFGSENDTPKQLYLVFILYV